MRDPEDIDWVARDSYLGQRIMTLLTLHYPGHGWIIEVKCKSGVFSIWNALISQRYGYLQRFSEIVDGTRMSLDKVVIRMAGELLERAQLRRGALDEAELFSKPLLRSGELGQVDKL